eukprot:5052582-Amphidinium_carterae.1
MAVDAYGELGYDCTADRCSDWLAAVALGVLILRSVFCCQLGYHDAGVRNFVAESLPAVSSGSGLTV